VDIPLDITLDNEADIHSTCGYRWGQAGRAGRIDGDDKCAEDGTEGQGTIPDT
jgi:hypothetical protein